MSFNLQQLTSQKIYILKAPSPVFTALIQYLALPSLLIDRNTSIFTLSLYFAKQEKMKFSTITTAALASVANIMIGLVEGRSTCPVDAFNPAAQLRYYGGFNVGFHNVCRNHFLLTRSQT